MDDKEFKAHVECLASMSMGFLMGNMDRATFTSNLGLLAGLMGARTPDQKPNDPVETCDECVEWWACDCVEKRKAGRT